MVNVTEEGIMRTLSRVLALAATVACVLAWSPAWAQTEVAEQKAVTAATAFLGLVDAGKNGESWDAAASYFKWTMPKDKWDAMLVNARVPLGRVTSRTLAAKKFVKDLPGAIKGDYVVMVFNTAFDAMPKAVENVTAMLEKDGTWRICGYNIKPAKY
jgi:Protein of unknown function (DUF4019)